MPNSLIPTGSGGDPGALDALMARIAKKHHLDLESKAYPNGNKAYWGTSACPLCGAASFGVDLVDGFVQTHCACELNSVLQVDARSRISLLKEKEANLVPSQRIAVWAASGKFRCGSQVQPAGQHIQIPNGLIDEVLDDVTGLGRAGEPSRGAVLLIWSLLYGKRDFGSNIVSDAAYGWLVAQSGVRRNKAVSAVAWLEAHGWVSVLSGYSRRVHNEYRLRDFSSLPYTWVSRDVLLAVGAREIVARDFLEVVVRSRLSLNFDGSSASCKCVAGLCGDTDMASVRAVRSLVAAGLCVSSGSSRRPVYVLRR